VEVDGIIRSVNTLITRVVRHDILSKEDISVRPVNDA